MEFNSPMARQFNGPVIDSLLNARHNVFNESEEFMLHRQGLTLENATTEELNLIGKFLCIPRPYAMINGEPEYCDDTFYRVYIRNLAILRQSQSIYDLARMFDQFMPDGRYFVSFQPNGDLLVVLDEQYIAYTPFFKKALDSVFTALPRINTLESWDFDKFVYQHRLYTRLISLTNSDWVFGIEQPTGNPYTRQTEFPWISKLTTIYQLRNGDILVGIYDIASEYVGLWRSTDNGVTFVHQDTLPSGFGVYDIIESSEGFILITGKDSNGKTGIVYYSWDNGVTYGAITIGSVINPPTENLRIYGEYEYALVGISSVGIAYDALNQFLIWCYENTSTPNIVDHISVMETPFNRPSVYKHVIAVLNRENYNIGFTGRQTNGLCKGEIGPNVFNYENVGSFEGLYICLVNITSNGILWVSCTTSGKLYYSSLEDLDNLQFQEKLDAVCYFMLEDSQGRIWTGGEGGKLYCSTDEGETFDVAFEPSDLPLGAHIVFQDMIELSDGSFYLYGTTDTDGSTILYKVSIGVARPTATVVSPSGKLTVNNHIATATIERRT